MDLIRKGCSERLLVWHLQKSLVQQICTNPIIRLSEMRVLDLSSWVVSRQAPTHTHTHIHAQKHCVVLTSTQPARSFGAISLFVCLTELFYEVFCQAVHEQGEMVSRNLLLYKPLENLWWMSKPAMTKCFAFKAMHHQKLFRCKLHKGSTTIYSITRLTCLKAWTTGNFHDNLKFVCYLTWFLTRNVFMFLNNGGFYVLLQYTQLSTFTVKQLPEWINEMIKIAVYINCVWTLRNSCQLYLFGLY